MDAPVTGNTLAPVRATLDSFGRIALPQNIRDALGVAAGDELLMNLEGEELRLFTRAAGLRVAQGIVSRYVRSGENLSDELLGDRRAEIGHDHA